MAASVARQPCTILTNNTKDFPPRPLAKRKVRVADPDTYLCEIVQELPDEVIDTLARLAAEKTRPPTTPQDLVDDLDRGGVPRFAEMVRLLVRPFRARSVAKSEWNPKAYSRLTSCSTTSLMRSSPGSE